MWRRALVRPSARSPPPLQRLHASSSGPVEPPARRKVYLIAGEPSGDAIGAKVIAALERCRRRGDPRAQHVQVRGIGGPLMCQAGAFSSLFPMRELSVMGLVELLPHVLHIRRRIGDTVGDIRAYRPDVVLSIDSKGFAFRVLRALQADPETRETVARMHYVAPSVWAYKHRRQKQDFTDMSDLLDAMFAILPFEEQIFNPRDSTAPVWCHFVGHPAVEDFFEHHDAFDKSAAGSVDTQDRGSEQLSVTLGPDALLDLNNYDTEELKVRARAVQDLLQTSVDHRETRAKHGIPANAFVICALVGSRQHEVRKSMQLVIDGVEAFAKDPVFASGAREVHVVFPTVAAVESEVKANLETAAPSFAWSVCCGLNVRDRSELFQSSNVAVAVSGTVVLETALANLPTVAIYRANHVTEWIVKRLAVVRFVSLPNLLLGREIIPELLFRDCTAENITQAIRQLRRSGRGGSEDLAAAVSTLTRWTRSNNKKQGECSDQKRAAVPVRASDLVAEHILCALDKKKAMQ